MNSKLNFLKDCIAILKLYFCNTCASKTYDRNIEDHKIFPNHYRSSDACKDFYQQSTHRIFYHISNRQDRLSR